MKIKIDKTMTTMVMMMKMNFSLTWVEDAKDELDESEVILRSHQTIACLEAAQNHGQIRSGLTKSSVKRTFLYKIFDRKKKETTHNDQQFTFWSITEKLKTRNRHCAFFESFSTRKSWPKELH